MTPGVPPRANRKYPRDLDNDICKLRNKAERLFGRLKSWRRIYTPQDKLDAIFLAFLNSALIFNMKLPTGFAPARWKRLCTAHA